jgi:hypothetical protein
MEAAFPTSAPEASSLCNGSFSSHDKEGLVSIKSGRRLCCSCVFPLISPKLSQVTSRHA